MACIRDSLPCSHAAAICSCFWRSSFSCSKRGGDLADLVDLTAFARVLPGARTARLRWGSDFSTRSNPGSGWQPWGHAVPKSAGGGVSYQNSSRVRSSAERAAGMGIVAANITNPRESPSEAIRVRRWSSASQNGCVQSVRATFAGSTSGRSGLATRSLEPKAGRGTALSHVERSSPLRATASGPSPAAERVFASAGIPASLANAAPLHLQEIPTGTSSRHLRFQLGADEEQGLGSEVFRPRLLEAFDQACPIGRPASWVR